jgi:hypothetical protein
MSEKKQEELLKVARKRMQMGLEALSKSREYELDDLKFLAGSPDNQWQWPSDVLNTRGAPAGYPTSARPCLTINKLPQHVNQVTNDQKQNRPSGKVIPVNDAADSKLADVYSGIIRHIEYISDADVAYDTACNAQVTTGEGYFRILTDWCDDDPWKQEIKIGRIRNQFSVVLDPMMQDPCGADAKWGFLYTDVLKDEYEKDYPDAKAVSGILADGVGDPGIGNWIGEHTIRIAEYFYIEQEAIEIYFYPAYGTVEKGSALAQEAAARGLEPTRTRTMAQKTVKWCKINGYEVLEENIWPGKWVPIIRVIGNEYEIDGELHISGLVRNAKDPQRMYNYWASQEAEMLALAPKAPFIGYAGQFEGYEQQWKTANTVPWPYLEVNPDVTNGEGSPLPLPQRSQPPMAQHGLIAAKMGAAEDIKSVTGQYDSSLGQTSNERSGKAILARERQSDTGTYHYVDNLARAIRYATRQIIDLIPKIYDTKRIARIMGEDGTVDQVKIDPTQPEARKDIVDESGNVIESIFNPGVGTYDVCVVTGPSYTTKRQESAEAMSNLVQGNPELWAVAGDLIVQNMDWPGADKLAERLKRTIDPKLLSDQQSPETLQMQKQMEELQQTNDQMRKMLENVQSSFEHQELMIKEYEAETKRISAIQVGMSPEQIQDIVMGTIQGMMDVGDLAGKPTGLINNTPPEQPMQTVQPQQGEI